MRITKKELKRQYVLVTPAKNEEKFLPNLIKSIMNQTVRPILWVIVDDRSTDQTPVIINEAREKNEWIQNIRLEEGIRDRGVHLAKIIKTGFDFAYNYCKKNEMYFEFVGNVDADLELESTYFEKLMNEFENDSKLGVASGGEWFVNDKELTFYNGRYPSGGNVLYRKRCYEDCGGIPLTDLWDSVLNTKAELRGWELKRFNDNKVLIMRAYCQNEGQWCGYKKLGEGSYKLNYYVFYVIAKGIKLSLGRPYYKGLAYLYGYLSSMILRKKRINDKEIKNYYRYLWHREIKQHYYDLFKSNLKLMVRR